MRDPKVHEEVIREGDRLSLRTVGLESRELEFSPIKGPEGKYRVSAASSEKAGCRIGGAICGKCAGDRCTGAWHVG